MGACTVYAPLDGKPKREWLAADFLNGFGRCLAITGAQEAKGADCDGGCTKLLLDESRHYIGLIRGQQMAIVPVGIGKDRGIIHPGLILQGHELHGFTFLGGDDLFGDEPPGERDFLSYILPYILGENVRGRSQRLLEQIERMTA